MKKQIVHFKQKAEVKKAEVKNITAGVIPKAEVKFDSIHNQAFSSPKEMEGIEEQEFSTEKEKEIWISKQIKKQIASKQKKAEERKVWIITQMKKHGANAYLKSLTK